VTQSADESQRVASQVKRVIRTNYSNPPTHGGAIVSLVLNSSELKAMWEEELAQMRERIKQMRAQLIAELKKAGAAKDFSFIAQQRGMFSYTGLTKDQVDHLIADHGVYAVGTGRICVASLNTKNVAAVAKAIAAVL
jgi:aromatic-amino-acid transaminase